MIKRDYQEKLLKSVDNKKIKVLQGVRRSGKTTLLYKLETDLLYLHKDASNFLFIDFESFNLEFSNQKDSVYLFLESFIKKNNEIKYLFLNEPQAVHNFQNLLKKIYEKYKNMVDIFISTSYKKLFSEDFYQEMYYDLEFFDIYPSFKEICNLQKNVDEKKLLSHYLEFGGFPFLYSFNQTFGRYSTHAYMQDILNAIIFKDIVQKNALRDSLTFTKVFSKIIEEVGVEFSSKDIIKYLKEENKTLSNETLYNYLDYTKDSFLIEGVTKINLQKNKALQYQEKLFLTDLGIRFPIYSNIEKNKLMLIQNLIFIKLKQDEYKISTGRYLDEDIDFICEKNKNKIYIQVSDYLNNEKIEKLSKIFNKIKDNFPKFFISLDEEFNLENGFKHINILDFLLDRSDLCKI